MPVSSATERILRSFPLDALLQELAQWGTSLTRAHLSGIRSHQDLFDLQTPEEAERFAAHLAPLAPLAAPDGAPYTFVQCPFTVVELTPEDFMHSAPGEWMHTRLKQVGCDMSFQEAARLLSGYWWAPRLSSEEAPVVFRGPSATEDVAVLRALAALRLDWYGSGNVPADKLHEVLVKLDNGVLAVARFDVDNLGNTSWRVRYLDGKEYDLPPYLNVVKWRWL